MYMSDDILGLVLGRVGSHVALIRAAAVCRRWRRAIADAASLRRYRSLHAPTVAGYYHNSPSNSTTMGVEGRRVVGPVFVPSSPLIVDARHFSLDFLPDGAGPWTLIDIRGSILLLDRWDLGNFPYTVVCEPLTRHYRSIPLPEDFKGSCPRWGPFLLDGEANELGSRISMSNFRVLFVVDHDGVYTAVFTGGSSWSEKDINHTVPNIGRSRILGSASGSCYFYDNTNMTLIDLDGSTGEFTSSVLPGIEDWDFHVWQYNCFVIEGRDGKPRIIIVFGDTMKVFARLNSAEWALEKRTILSEATRRLPGYQPSFFGDRQNIVTVGVGFVILSPQYGGPWPFSVNIETMEAAPAADDMGLILYRCELPWPPALHACLD